MTRILVVSDIHGTMVGLHSIREMMDIHSPELLAISGDITDFGRAEWKGNVLDKLDIPIMAVNGNCDSMDVVGSLLADKERGLMNRERVFDGLRFLGFGHPIDKEIIFKEGFEILVSHVPPQGCNDRIPGGNRGDGWLREFVMKHSPRLVLSGHIHESRGICKLGESVCVNPGPAMYGYGVVVDIGAEIQAELFSVKISAKL